MTPSKPTPPQRRHPRTANALAFRIAEHTAQAIERGELKQGDRIREQALAEQFDCSRSPVREALRLLESQALVVIEPLRGARVVRVEEADFHEVFYLRRAVGAVVARLAAERGAVEEKIKLLNGAQSLLILATERADTEVYSEQASALLLTIRGLAGASRATRLITSLTLGRTPFQSDVFPTQERRLAFAQQWLRLAGAVLASDASTAEDLVREMYDDALAEIRLQQASPAPTEPRREKKKGATTRAPRQGRTV